MIAFPNCKINIGLHITGRLPDGYHSIETCMYPIPLRDILEIVPATDKETRLFLSGTSEFIPTERNIVYKAWKLLHDKYKIPAVDIYLHKIIPSGAGLGGGSSDAAFTLRLLNDMFLLGLNSDQLENEAATLGMDCPFFIRNSPAIASGKGERIDPVALNLKGYYFVLVKPEINVSTAGAYALINPQIPEKNITELIQFPVENWKDLIGNDFEIPVFNLHPEIRKIKDIFYSLGALYAQMSGSGSAVFGLFITKPEITAKFQDCFVFDTLISEL